MVKMLFYIVKMLCHVIFTTVILTIILKLPAVLAQNNNRCSMTSPCTPLQGGDIFQRPQEVYSSGGELKTRLIVDVGNVSIDWLSVQRRLYNGTFPGPTIRIRPNDMLYLQLVNELQEPDYNPNEQNVFGFPNTTNIHTHGLHISSQFPQDNPFIRIGPNTFFTYQYEINREQPAGTYLYHSHLHTAGAFQVSSGMVGMLIVEDDPDSASELGLISCPNNCHNDIPIVIQNFQYAAIDDAAFAAAQRDIRDYEGFRLNNITINNSTTTLEEWLEDPVNNIQYFLVNGVLHPKMTMRPGETKRFRLLNAGGLHSLALQIVATSGISACDVREIAIDGIYLEEPRRPRLGRSLLVSAGRVDWVVRCSNPGTYQLESAFTSDDERSMGDHPTFNGLLMTIEVIGEAKNDPLPQTLPSLPSFLRDLRSISESEIDARFAVEVTATDSLNREDFAENYIRYRMEVDTVQEWFFTNTEFETSHPIHMHINSFQVISYNKYTGPYAVDDGESGWALFNQSGDVCDWQHKNYGAGLSLELPDDPLKYLGHEEAQATVNSIGYATIGDHRDTLLVPPLANITVRFIAANYTGDVAIHCHLLPDADQGMLMTAQVVERGASTEANITSAGAYPWGCFKNDPIPQPPGNGAVGSRYVSTFVPVLLLLGQQFFTLH